ncbi:MAG: Trk system potassium transporter TrkA [Actinobacteria bacterium]|nr:Trk system potassium transporter TrkA [Actinomycetota bacterium]
MRSIVVGAGVLGFNLARRLSRENHSVVVVDHDEAKVRHAQESLDVGVVHGQGSGPSVLLEAGLEQADMLVAVTGSDETNIVACLIAQTLNHEVVRIARLRDPAYLGPQGIIHKAALDVQLVISPEQEVAHSVGLLAAVPGASDVLDFVGGRVKVVGVRIDPGSPLDGKPISAIRWLAEEQALLAGVYREEMVYAPSTDMRLAGVDTLFIVTTQESTRRVVTRLGKRWVRTRHVMIAGGGRRGVAIAKHLSAVGVHTRIIDPDAALCERLVEEVGESVVLCGDPLDQDLLRDEGAGRTDLFVGATNDEQQSVFAALLAKHLGARRVVALVDTPNHVPFALRIGVDVVLSPMLTALGPLLQFVRRGEVVSVSTLREELVEGIEFIASADSEIVGLPLGLLRMPRGSLVGAIVRDEQIIIPDGNSVIQQGDRVVLFARPQLIPRLQRLVART